MLDKNTKFLPIRSYFRIAFVFIGLIDLIFYVIGLNFEKILLFVIILMMFYLIYDFIKNYKNYIDDKLQMLLLGYLIIVSISTLIYRKYVSIHYEFFVVIVYFFIFFKQDDNYNNQIIKREFIIILNLVVIITFFMSFFTLILNFIVTNKYIWINDYLFTCEDGLHGFYSTTTTAGIYAFLSFGMSCIGIVLFKKKIFLSLFLGLNILVQLLLILLGDCRSSKIALIIFCTYVLFKYLYKFKNKYANILVFSTILLIVTFSISIIVFLNNRNFINIVEGQFNNRNEVDFYNLLNKITSSRLDLWIESIKLSISESSVIGHGVYTMTRYAESILGYNSLISRIGYYNSHNLFINIFYASGLLGMMISFRFIYLCYKKLSNKQGLIYWFVSAFIIGIFFISMLDVIVLFKFKVTSLIFWLLLSYGVYSNYEDN